MPIHTDHKGSITLIAIVLITVIMFGIIFLHFNSQNNQVKTTTLWQEPPTSFEAKTTTSKFSDGATPNDESFESKQVLRFAHPRFIFPDPLPKSAHKLKDFWIEIQEMKGEDWSG